MMFKKRQRAPANPTLISPSSEGISIEDLSAALVPVTGSSRFAIVVHGLLAPDECANLIRRAEEEGFDDALVQGPGGEQIMRKDIRSCGRCIIDDAGLADAVYLRIVNALRGTESEKKIKHAPWIAAKAKSRKESQMRSSVASSASEVSATSTGGADNNTNTEEGAITAVGLNERMRFLKYAPGHFFAPHQDIRYVRGPDAGERAGETSHITVQLYLNDKFKGGATRFLCGKRHYDVRPKVGSALIFDHDLLHEGSKVTGGIKYSVRSDIMFTPLRGDAVGSLDAGRAGRTVTPESGSGKKVGSAPVA